MNFTIANDVIGTGNFIQFDGFTMKEATSIVQANGDENFQIHTTAIGMTEFGVDDGAGKTFAGDTFTVPTQNKIFICP